MLSNSTTLNVGSGAAIAAPMGAPGIGAYDNSANSIVVTGGSVTGGSDSATTPAFGNSGIEMHGGTLNISGGTLTGGSANFIPGAGIYTVDTAVIISGGTFYGGSNTATPFDDASDGLQISGGNVLLTGGTFIGGDGGTLAGGSGVTFGYVRNGDAPSLPTYALIMGGTFSAGPGAFSEFAYSLSIGYSHPADVDLKGGEFIGAILVDTNSVLNIYGDGLSATPTALGEHVSGTLQDGTPISVDTEIVDGTVNLINVPEPSSFLLAASGIGFIAWGWRQRLNFGA